MTRFGDPGFKIHTAIGQWMTLVLYHIADDALIPWDLPNAALVLQSYLSELNSTIAESDYPGLDLSPLEFAIAEFEHQAAHIAQVAETATAFGDEVLLGVVNAKFRDFARGFASQGGLPGRETFRNVISAPGIDNGYGADVWPAVTDSVGKGDESAARLWVEKSAAAVLRAAEILRVGS